MNVKTWIPLVLAIVFAVVAAKAARDWMIKNQAAKQPSGKFAKIVVAKDDIAPGRALTPEDFTTADIEADKVPAGSFDDPAKLAGRVNETFIVKNQPLVDAMLAPDGAGSGLQAVIPNGQRAITMEVNEFSGVAGLLTPGCRVDIIATINSGDDGQVSKTIVQNVKVTAVGQRMAAAGANEPPPPPGELFRSVTILCSLQESESIELACATGRPRLVLRGGRDNAIVATAGVSMGELRGAGGSDTTVAIAAPPPTTVPATTEPTETATTWEPPRRVVRVIRGGNETNVTLNVLDGNPDTAFGGTDNRDPFESH